MIGAKLIIQLVNWTSTLYVMRILEPSDYGLIAMAMVLVSLLSMINEMGLGQALVQADEIDDYKVRQCFGLVILVNSSAYLLLCALAPITSLIFKSNELSTLIPVIGLQFIVQIFIIIPTALLDRNLLFRERSIFEIAASISGVIVTLGMAIYGFGVWAIVLGNLATTSLYVLFVNLKFPFPHLPVFEFKGIFGIAKYGFLTVLNRILWYIYSQADTFVVARLLGVTALGYYSVGVQIASLPLAKISGIFNQLGLAGYSSIKRNRAAMSEGVVSVARTASFLSFPVFWGMSAVASEFIVLVLGPNWKAAIVPLQFIAAILPFRVLSIALSQAVNAAGRPDLNVTNLTVACILMPLSFCTGGYFYGLEGICFAWIAAYPFWFLYTLRQGLPLLNVHIKKYIKTIFPPFLFSLAMTFSISMVRGFIPSNSWPSMFILVLTGAVVYASLAWFTSREYTVKALAALRMNQFQ